MRYFKQGIAEDDPAFNLMRQASPDDVGDVWHSLTDSWEPHPSLTVSMELNNDWQEISAAQVPQAKNEVKKRVADDLAEVAARAASV